MHLQIGAESGAGDACPRWFVEGKMVRAEFAHQHAVFGASKVVPFQLASLNQLTVGAVSNRAFLNQLTVGAVSNRAPRNREDLGQLQIAHLKTHKPFAD